MYDAERKLKILESAQIKAAQERQKLVQRFTEEEAKCKEQFNTSSIEERLFELQCEQESMNKELGEVNKKIAEQKARACTDAQDVRTSHHRQLEKLFTQLKTTEDERIKQEEELQKQQRRASELIARHASVQFCVNEMRRNSNERKRQIDHDIRKSVSNP